MKIAIASDHAGFDFKQKLAAELSSLGHDVFVFGPVSDVCCVYA